MRRARRGHDDVDVLGLFHRALERHGLAAEASGSSESGGIGGKVGSSAGSAGGITSGKTAAVSSGSPAVMAPANPGRTALSYEEQKRQRAEKRKREKEEERIFAQLAETENKIRELENQLANPEVYTDGEKARSILQQIHALQATSAELTEQWEALN